MNFLPFAKRNIKEIFRDPLSMILGVALPIMMLLIFVLINNSIAAKGGVDLPAFRVESMTPGIIVFSYSFLTMFTAVLISKDRSTAFMLRLKVSPMKANDFIFGYSLPMIPFALVQTGLTFLVAVILGMPITTGIFIATAVSIFQAIFSIFVGMLMGASLSETQVLAVGNIYIIACTFLGGTYLDLHMVGGGLEKIAYLLPFAHATDMLKNTLAGNYNEMFTNMAIVIAYTLVAFVCATLIYRKKLNEG